MISNKTKNKNKFLKIFSIFLIGFFAFFLAFMPFFMNNNKDKVMADSVSTDGFVFNSSSSLFYVNFCSSDSVRLSLTDYANPSLLCLRFTLSQYGLYFTESWCSYYGFANPGNAYIQGGLDYTRNNVTSFIYDNYVYHPLYCSANLFDNKLISCEYFISTGFNFNVVSVSFNSTYDDFLGQYHGTQLLLLDTEGNRFLFNFPLSDSNYSIVSHMLYNPVKNYFLSSDLTDNQFYNQGYSDGYNAGESVGNSLGYSDGFDAGYLVGESAGYNAGVEYASDYSFFGLFSAAFDVPVQTFNGLFDFNFSFDGEHTFNLKGFFLTILTIAFVIMIVRFALSR